VFNRHNKKLKEQELAVLLQGIELPPGKVTAETSLPQARQLVPPPTASVMHMYTVQSNTAGQARTQHKKVSASQGAKPSTTPVVILPAIAQWTQSSPLSLPVQASKEYVPSRATMYRQKKKLKEGLSKGKPERAAVPYRCSKCTQERTSATGHYGYRGYWFCPLTANLSHEEWLDSIKAKFQ
jgi:hypothetical protein